MLTNKELEYALTTHRSTVYRLAVSYLGNAADSEDITQEVFIRLYMRHKPLGDDGQTKAWLIRVTANLCKNQLRSHWRKSREELSEDTEDAGSTAEQERRELKSALESLNPGQRAVICLYYYEGLSAKEIAKLLKISETAVTTRLQRGRAALKKFLTEDE